jgi:uncharacterized protein YyaL (SSP411 family)
MLVGVGMTLKVLKPLIPRDRMNKLGKSEEEFLQQGEYDTVDWNEFGDEAFAEARKTSKPILLSIGAPCSCLGRSEDQDFFSDSQIARLLNQNFVCVRIDGLRHPDWLNAMLPFGRLYSHLDTGAQLWVVDPAGRLISSVRAPVDDQRTNHNDALESFVEARDKYQELEPRALEDDSELPQVTDMRMLASADLFLSPNYRGFLENLHQHTNAKFGGIESFSGYQGVTPLAWKYQVMVGDSEGLHASLDPILSSPMTDLLDGGFYRVSNSDSPNLVEFDKMTIRNAEMLTLLVTVAKLENNAVYDALAHRTWDYLAKEAYRDGEFATCRVGDERADGRSDHSSFSPARLRRIMDSDDISWCSQNLGMDPSINPHMTVFPRNLSVLLDGGERLERVLKIFRDASAKVPKKYAGLGRLDTGGACLARMLEAARIWGNADYMSFALDAADRAASFVDTDGSLKPDLYDVTKTCLLPDYLAYADMELQYYLCTGRVMALETGLAKLREALDRFSTDQAGVYRLAPKTIGTPLVQHAEVPEIADNTHESCTGQIIRLCLAYGRLYGDSPSGRELIKRAKEASGRFALITDKASTKAAGYYADSAMLDDNAYAIAVGPDAQRQADALVQKVPTRFVAPAFGELRQDLQRVRRSGIYVLHGQMTSGPFTVEQAAAALSPVYSVLGGPVDTAPSGMP